MVESANSLKDIFSVVSQDPFSITSLIINLIVGLAMALAIRWHYKKFGSTLSNREELSQVFPFILLTTVLIITIVKSSIALSLGLVGALSIVRFRTPIKEPEELAYLFISIAIGLGLGAGQTLATTVAGFTILGLIALLRRGWIKERTSGKNLYLSIDWHSESLSNEVTISALNDILSRYASKIDLRRYDTRKGAFEATYLIDIIDDNSLHELTSELKDRFPDIGVTYIDQKQLPAM
jgi:uncharacterized membrane protein YhiD involved in acid resistance